MNHFSKRAVVAICFLLLIGCDKSGVPLMGLDEDGNEVTYFVSEKKYVQHLEKIMVTAQESVQPSLVQINDQSKWSIRTVVLGLGLNAEFGVGSLSAGASPRMRFAFSNSQKPMLP